MARQRALAVLARIEARGAASDDDVHPRLVHLTRLEHGPVRAARAGSAGRRAAAAGDAHDQAARVARISSRPKAA